jgi:hypothetical protein
MCVVLLAGVRGSLSETGNIHNGSRNRTYHRIAEHMHTGPLNSMEFCDPER